MPGSRCRRRSHLRAAQCALPLSLPLSASCFPLDSVVAQGRGRRHVYVHPHSGEATGDGARMDVQRLLRDAHRRLMRFQTFGGVRIRIVLDRQNVVAWLPALAARTRRALDAVELSLQQRIAVANNPVNALASCLA